MHENYKENHNGFMSPTIKRLCQEYVFNQSGVPRILLKDVLKHGYIHRQFCSKHRDEFVKLNLVIVPADKASNNMEIKDQIMETSVYFGLIWDDPRFKWSDKAEYSSITSIRTNNEYTWIPRVAIANSIVDLSVLVDKHMFITAYPTGTMLLVIGEIDRTHCNCDVTYYPFDTQTCELVLIGLGYLTDEVELTFNTNPVSMTFFSENGEWEYLRSTTKIDDTSYEGSIVRQLKFELTFRRRPLFQFINSLLPVTLLSCLTSLIFKLPADSGEKIGFCLTVLLAFAVYVTIVSDHIPTSSITTSYLSLYLILILSMGIVAVFVTIFVLECHHTDDKKPIPIWLKKITRNVMMPLVCCHRGGGCRGRCCCRPPTEVDILETFNNDMVKPIENAPKEKELTWKEIAKIIDSFSFIVVLLINIIMGIATYSALLYGYVNP